MATDSRVEIVKNLIEEDRLRTFQDIFLYLPKTFVAKKMGIYYNRFLELVKNPKRFRMEEIYTIAGILGVTPRQISELIHRQIEMKKKK